MRLGLRVATRSPEHRRIQRWSVLAQRQYSRSVSSKGAGASARLAPNADEVRQQKNWTVISPAPEERETGIEPATTTLATWCSTTELLPQVLRGEDIAVGVPTGQGTSRNLRRQTGPGDAYRRRGPFGHSFGGRPEQRFQLTADVAKLNRLDQNPCRTGVLQHLSPTLLAF